MDQSSELVRAERRQRRMDRKRRRELPLFAAAGDQVLDSVAPLPTVEALVEAGRRYQISAYVGHLRLLKHNIDGWLRYRAAVEPYVTMDQIAYMEGYCRRTYPSHEYRGGYYRALACELGLIAGPGRLSQTPAMLRR